VASEESAPKPFAVQASFAVLPALVAAMMAGLAGGFFVQHPGVDESGAARGIDLAFDPLWALGAFLPAWALALVGARLASSLTLFGAVQSAYRRLAQSGLAIEKEPMRWHKPEQVAESLDALAERAAAQVIASRKEMGKFKDALSRYADPSLAKNLSQESSLSKMGTRKVRMAILFCDIRGFTKMSEALKVEDVVSVLNSYFALGAKAVTANRGEINKFIGDAILAVFPDPPGMGSGMTACRNAVAAAMAMHDAFRLEERKWKEGIDTPFEAGLGIGVHIGEVIQGTMGSPERLEYTVIGDPVNFASRLCSLAKAGQVRLSEECYKNVDDRVTVDEMEPVAVKGKSGTYKTFQITGKKPGYF
jgi:class 3 adenylate cyclase